MTGGGTKNRWLQSELARGKLEGLRLVAPREMVRVDALQPGRVPSTANFNQRDRARQRAPGRPKGCFYFHFTFFSFLCLAHGPRS